MGLTSGSGRSPGEGNGNLFQYSCLGNPMDRGAWQAKVQGIARVGYNLVTKSLPLLSQQHFCFPGGLDGKESACNAGDPGLILGVGKIPWRREWLSTPVPLPGEFHGWRGLKGYHPWGRKELDTTEQH